MGNRKGSPGRPRKEDAFRVVKSVAFTHDQWKEIEQAARLEEKEPSVFVRESALRRAGKIVRRVVEE